MTLTKAARRRSPILKSETLKRRSFSSNFQGGGKFAFYTVQGFGLECPTLSKDLSASRQINININ
jgi:hypothetical protein